MWFRVYIWSPYVTFETITCLLFIYTRDWKVQPYDSFLYHMDDPMNDEIYLKGGLECTLLLQYVVTFDFLYLDIDNS